jgi:hypothetical protein
MRDARGILTEGPNMPYASILAAGLLCCAALRGGGQSADERTALSHRNACLGLDSPSVQALVGQVQSTVTKDSGSHPRLRERLHGGEKLAASEVRPVVDEALCARALALVRDHLAGHAYVAEQIALVEAGSRYVGIVEHRFKADLPATRGVFYMNRGLSKVLGSRRY